MSTRVALLRGINVGGRHRLPMARAREVLEAEGLGPVASHIQSGNLVLHAEGGDDEVAARVRALLESVVDFPVPTLVLDAGAVRATLVQNPFTPELPRLEHFVLLPRRVDQAQRARLEALQAEFGGRDELAVGPRVVWISHPDGLAQSTLATRVTAFLKEGTARNLATMQAIAALLD